jgi:hypothetical protein
MVNDKAARASALTVPPLVVRSSLRFLLPRASCATCLRLPALPAPTNCSLDLLLGGGIPAKFDGWPTAEPLLVQYLWK